MEGVSYASLHDINARNHGNIRVYQMPNNFWMLQNKVK